MYKIGHDVFKLNGIITEFADIYAPLAQLWKWDTSVNSISEASWKPRRPAPPTFQSAHNLMTE